MRTGQAIWADVVSSQWSLVGTCVN